MVGSDTQLLRKGGADVVSEKGCDRILMLVFMADQRGQGRPLSHTLTAHGLTGTAYARQVEWWATGNERKRDLRNIR